MDNFAVETAPIVIRAKNALSHFIYDLFDHLEMKKTSSYFGPNGWLEFQSKRTAFWHTDAITILVQLFNII